MADKDFLRALYARRDVLWLDLETASPRDIKSGAYRYAEEAEVLLFAWAVNEAPAQVWEPNTQPMPPELDRLMRGEKTLYIAHNSNFDRTVLRARPEFRTYQRLGDPENWRDTMIMAAALSLPRSLDGLCTALGLPQDKAKDKAGKALIRKFCHGDQLCMMVGAEWDRFVEYCGQDVEAMRTCAERMPLDYIEPDQWRQIFTDWALDQRINDRGMMIDTELAIAVQKACARESEALCERLTQLTGGEADAPTKTQGIMRWLAGRGYSVPDLTAATVDGLLNRADLPEDVRAVAEIRQCGALASPKKYNALLDAVNVDNRLRGCLAFMGTARTGRFSGRIFQPQNLPRGSFKPEQVATAIESFKSGTADLCYASPTAAAKECLRALITAPEGCKLCVADLSNIEGRTLAWLAGEKWKLNAFADFDAGHGVDLYKATYARTFQVDPADVTKKQRQIGKVMELGLGYQGGVGAFVNFARVYGIDLEGEFLHAVRNTADPADLRAGEEAFEWQSAQPDYVADLSPDAWAACYAVRTAWRRAHPAITEFWAALGRAVTAALSPTHRAGMMHRAGDHVLVTAYPHGDDLRDVLIRLPSGRSMLYPGARPAYASERALMIFEDCEYSATPTRTYSGKLCENVTQAVARDILVGTMQSIEDRGYKIVLSVHDELITECPDAPEYSHGELSRLMATAPEWAKGLPLAAAGFEAMRYRKD